MPMALFATPEEVAFFLLVSVLPLAVLDYISIISRYACGLMLMFDMFRWREGG